MIYIPQPFDGRYAVCPNCGTLSQDYNDCEYCKKVLPDDCKMYDPIAAKEEESRRKSEAAKKAETERMLLIKLVSSCHFVWHSISPMSALLTARNNFKIEAFLIIHFAVVTM